MALSLIGILPCAGTASRIGGLPKFMFPMNGKECLLSIWIKKLLEFNCERVTIPCSDTTHPFVVHITSQLKEDRITVVNVGKL